MANPQRPYFQSVQWSTSTAYAVLAAMKAVATLNGDRPLDQISHEMLVAVQDWVFETKIEVEDLSILSPIELAEEVQDLQILWLRSLAKLQEYARQSCRYQIEPDTKARPVLLCLSLKRVGDRHYPALDR